MNQIDELVARCRPDPRPDPDVMSRHRAELHTLIDHANRPDAAVKVASAADIRSNDNRRSAYSRRRLLVGSAAAGLVAAAAAAIPTLRSNNHSAAPATPTEVSAAGATTAPVTPPASDDDGVGALLYPTGDDTTVEWATTSQIPPGRWATTVVDPTGEPKLVAMNENFFGDDLPNWDQRNIGTVRVRTGNEDGNTVYAVINRCSLLTVNDGASIPWDREVSDLLEGLTVEDPAGTVTLPAGWRDLGVGPLTTSYDLSFTVTVDGADHQLELTQMPGTTIGALAAQRSSGIVEPADVNGVEGWLFQASSTRYIGWQTDAGIAVMLGGDTVLNVAALVTVAALLEPGHPTEWDAFLNPAGTNEVTETVAVADASQTAGCAVPSLTVN